MDWKFLHSFRVKVTFFESLMNKLARETLLVGAFEKDCNNMSFYSHIFPKDRQEETERDKA